MEWVFAYGSNMSLSDLHQWLGGKGYPAEGILQVARAELPGYQLVWNYHSTRRRGGAANVEPAPNASLPGLALRVTHALLARLDEKEGHPGFYSRGETGVRVTLEGGEIVAAWLYVALAERCRDVPVWPRRDYLHLLVQAAREHRLPASHIASLEQTPTVD